MSWWPILQALLAAALFGASPPLAKRLGLDAYPLWGSALLYGGAAVAMIVWTLAGRLRPGAPREASLRRSDAPALAGIVLFGGLVAPILLLTGLARTGAATASLLLNLETAFTAVLAVALFREHLGRAGVLGTLAILSGAVFLAWSPGGGPTSIAGIAAVAGACFGWALDNNLTGRLSVKSPRAIVIVKGLGAGACASAIALAVGAPRPPAGVVLPALALGAVSYGLSLLLFVRAMRAVGTARTGALFATAPFLGAIGAWAFLGESPGWGSLGAGAAMLVGVALFLRERHEHAHAHEAMDHEHLHVHDEHHQHAHDGSEGPEPHSHAHHHEPLRHSHAHVSDPHHRHRH